MRQVTAIFRHRLPRTYQGKPMPEGGKVLRSGEIIDNPSPALLKYAESQSVLRIMDKKEREEKNV